MSDDDAPGPIGFQMGNAAWRARSSHGRRPKFETPEALLDACEEYLSWVEENPLMTAEAVKFQGTGTLMGVPKLRAMTIGALCNFLDIEERTWRNYRGRDDYFPVVSRVESLIRQQKFEGAAAGLLNPNIIARDLGLGDKEAPDSDVPEAAPTIVLKRDAPK